MKNRKSYKVATRQAEASLREEALAEIAVPTSQAPAHLGDVLNDAMRSLPELVADSQRDSRKIFEAFAEPFFGEDCEFNHEEEVTLP